MAFDPLSKYLTEVREAPRLQEQHEADLARRIQAGVRAAHLLDEGTHGPAEHKRLESEKSEGERAKRELIEGSLHLVVAAALRHPDVSTPLLDLIQEGNIGLIRAVERFDPSDGQRFEEFANALIGEALWQATEEA